MPQTDTFATAIACIDGRVQAPLRDFVRELAGASHIDMVTWPGANAALAESEIDAIRRAVTISVDAHQSRLIVVTGHHDCAAHPAGQDDHKKLIGRAVERVRSWGLSAEVVGAWIGPDWNPEAT